MNRDDIIKAIQEIAVKNSNTAPGIKQFEKATGITVSMWRGKYWLRWSDAVSEAGFAPNIKNTAYEHSILLSKLAELTKKCGHFPIYAEIRMARHEDKSFPAHQAFSRLGNQDERIKLLRDFAIQHTQYNDILKLLPPENGHSDYSNLDQGKTQSLTDGHVYMLKLGKHYKIGKTYSVPRRHREINLELPEKTSVVHSIRTDDPDGIEKYWHGRFEQKRTNGEWFALNQEDIRTFKRRKFM